MEVKDSIFEGLDWVVLGIYFAVLVGVAVWVALQKNKNTERLFFSWTKCWMVCHRCINFCV